MLLTNAERVGITIDQSGVHYVKLKKKKGWEIDSCGVLPFEPGWIQDDQFEAVDELHNRLLAWVRLEKLMGASVTVSVPTSLVIIRKLMFEAANAKELRQLVELEVETALHLPFDKPVFDFIDTGVTDGKHAVLIYASPLKWIQQCMQLLEGAGLKVKFAELGSTALARAIQAKVSVPFDNTMLIHLQNPNIEVYMFHNGHPVFMRVMNEYEQYAFGMDGLGPELIASVNAEISRLLNFYQYSIHEGESRITHTIISGNVQGRDRLQAEFSELHPDMMVESVSFEAPEVLERSIDDFRIPYGLALRENKDSDINLLPARVIGTTNLPLPYVVSGLIFFLCVIAMLITYGWNSANSNELKEKAETLTQSNAAMLQELANLNKQSQADADPEAVIQTLLENRQDVVKVLDYLQDQLPIGASLQTVEYSKPGSVALLIKFADMEHIANYLTALRRFPDSGAAFLLGYTGTGTEWTARYEMSWKGEELLAEGEGGTSTNDSE